MEYTARIAPAQLGKATVNRYRKPAATGWNSALILSTDIGIHANIVFLVTWPQLLSCAATDRSGL
jgi:hypothetical protein